MDQDGIRMAECFLNPVFCVARRELKLRNWRSSGIISEKRYIRG